MELASAKFNICEAGDNSAITEKIKSELAMLPKQETVDGRAADKVIKSLKMHPDKHIWVQCALPAKMDTKKLQKTK